MKGTRWLMLIVAVSWILILAESYVFFAVIRPIGPPLHSGPIPSSLAKIAATVALGAVWFVVMLSLRAVYLRSRESRTPT